MRVGKEGGGGGERERGEIPGLRHEGHLQVPLQVTAHGLPPVIECPANELLQVLCQLQVAQLHLLPHPLLVEEVCATL